MQEQLNSTRRLYVVGILLALFVYSLNVHGVTSSGLSANQFSVNHLTAGLLSASNPTTGYLSANPLSADAQFADTPFADVPFANAVSGSPDKLSSNSMYAEGDHTPVSRDKTDANVFGHVLDISTKEHLPYVTIQLKGTTVGTTTDATGHYFIKNLPGRRFAILVKYVGYKTVEQEVPS